MAWRTASYTNDPRRSGTRAIPGYTGHLHNAKDVFGVSAGKALQQDSEGVDHTTLKKPKRSAASSTLLSPLDCDGAIWDHHYETSNQAMTSVTAADFDAKNADHGKQVQPNIVGYTGHIHMSHDILGASHDSVVRVSQNARREQLRNIKPLTEESRPHWTAFRAGNKTNPAWKQEYAQILTTRPNPKKSEMTPEQENAVMTLKEKMLQEQIKAATDVLGTTTPHPMTPTSTRSPLMSAPRETFTESVKEHAMMTLAGPEDERSYTGHFSSALPSRRIVGYTGHLRGTQDTIGQNFGRVERLTDPHDRPRDPPHPLGQRYQNAAPPGPPISPQVKQLVQKASKPTPAGVPIIDTVKTKIMQRGGRNGFRSLVRVLRVLDDDGNKKLSRYELLNGLNTYGIHPSQLELDELMIFLDPDGSGQITVTEFARAIRGEMKPPRRALVLQAYRLLDENCDGSVTLGDIQNLYDTSKHPEVLAGEKTAKEVLQDFTAGWDKNQDNQITEREFCDYYNDISAGIDDDQYFELMIRNAWHISGGEGAAENTSCRRVLVIHTDGSETIEEIKNDLGIGAHDKEKMLQNLLAQGVTDIKHVRPYA
jgi:Ca2+-binding EF-hand superfamily protein|uniref:EF-hand domain-containing protein n=1 Tax=Eutreptiella gymnastica TaxID=73025 RepID=A0A7S4CNR2_9EUGL|eukprot:CAMPEP_0174288620 /NCGR_PEP_ID=MMETSP0809-20121228/21578_1 /TAXON_ID=73025 ORGANISM="Eutreptiella gymnastica-like, Strain CCMP1594" /NCGR_SAMPLE_ID=MMETSP0809 /ASSEMBLY_ACC=CAM_ASM_000658 /LENGTH=593 /DNA_ID=CAMNT_0015385981 /DNA_START=31 /DNA_END=1812 /DNA_ORIENTATION=+